MTSAASVLQAMFRLAAVIHDAYAKAKGDDTNAEWKHFLESPEFRKVLEGVASLTDLLDGADVRRAIREIDGKQVALLASRPLSTLTTAELAQYSALSRARLLLATRNLRDALNPSFLEWLAKEALPVLVDVMPVVVPLLL